MRLAADDPERALHPREGEIKIAGEVFAPVRLLVFRPGDPISLRAQGAVRLGSCANNAPTLHAPGPTGPGIGVKRARRHRPASPRVPAPQSGHHAGTGDVLRNQGALCSQQIRVTNLVVNGNGAGRVLPGGVAAEGFEPPT